MKLFKSNRISTTILQIGNFYVKWWKNQPNFGCGKIVVDAKTYVWYAQFYKLEIAYDTIT